MTDTFTPASFATDVLTGIGAPLTPENINLLEGWERVEGGNWSNTARFNPLNTSLKEPGSVNFTTRAPGGGVQSFPDAPTGIAATISTLLERAYTGVVSGFRTSDPSATAAAIVASPWDAGHYSNDPNVLLNAAHLPAGTSTTLSSNVVTPVAAKSTTGASQTPSTAGKESAAATKPGPRILSSLDDILNVHGLSVLDPLTDAKVVIARGAVVMVGLAFGVAGLILMVSSIGQKVVRVTGPVGSAATTIAGVAAA